MYPRKLTQNLVKKYSKEAAFLINFLLAGLKEFTVSRLPANHRITER